MVCGALENSSLERRMIKRIVLIFTFSFALLIFGGGCLLKYGIHIQHFTVGSLTLDNVHLHWPEKLVLTVETLSLTKKSEKNAQQALDVKILRRLSSALSMVDRLFSKVVLERIDIGEKVSADFLYNTQVGHLHLFSSLGKAELHFSMDDALLTVDIPVLSYQQYQASASGTMRFDLSNETAKGQWDVLFADSLPLHLDVLLDREKISFSGKEDGEITTITPFVKLFGLDDTVQPWITDYLKGSRYVSLAVSGELLWDSPARFLKSVFAKVRVYDCQYTFAQGFAPVKSEYTDVVFENGVLKIVPYKATFYGQDTGKSWVAIDFNDTDNILLTVHLMTSAVANKDIVDLLAYYDIALPFIQKTGKTEVNLDIGVNLDTDQVTAHGKFLIPEATILHDKQSYVVHDVRIRLEDSKIFFDSLQVTQQDFLAASLHGYYEAAKEVGELEIDVENLKLSIGDSVLSLQNGAEQCKLSYHIQATGSNMEVSSSSWKWNDLIFAVDGFRTPFTLEDLSGLLPPTYLHIGSEVLAKVEGAFSIGNKSVDLQCFLESCALQKLHLNNSPLPIHIQYDNGLRVKSLSESNWLMAGKEVVLSPLTWTYYDDVLSLESEQVVVDTYATGRVRGYYDFFSEKGEYFIDHFHLLVDEGEKFFATENSLAVELDGSGKSFVFKVPELDLRLTADMAKGWSLHFNDLDGLHEHSTFLQQLRLQHGELTLFSVPDKEAFQFAAVIPHEYHLLLTNKSPVTKYTVTGMMGSSGLVEANINGKLDIRFDDSLHVKSSAVSYNVPEIIRFVRECNLFYAKPTHQQKPFTAKLEATDTALYFSPQSEAPLDALSLNYDGEKTYAFLDTTSGYVTVSVQGDELSVTGERLDDRFMNGLSPDASLQGGSMAIAANGKFDDFSVLVKVEDTVMKDFATLNNILALINTIPALITFNLPGYSSSGLQVKSMVLGARVKGGVATIEAAELEATELSLAGAGWIDLIKKQMDMDLNLITRSKKNMNKIPLVGYIFVGEEKQPSITLKVTGDLMDPDVEYETFREVLSIPFGMLYRTLALPAHLASPFLQGNEKGEEDEN